MKKKILSFVLIGIMVGLVCTLTGCGKISEKNPKTLADVVEVGDYVNYDANLGLTYPVTYKPDSSLTGYEPNSKQSTYSSADKTKWKVLSIDKKTGTVELVAEKTMANLYLAGKEGYINAETVLNNIGAVYGKGKGAAGGRSINIEDIEQYSSYDPSRFKSSGGEYGETKEYTSGNFIKTEEVTGGVEDKTDSRLVVASKSNPVTVKKSYYSYNLENYIENKTVYNMLFKNGDNYKSFWLASHCVFLGDNYYSFNVQYVDNGVVEGSGLKDSKYDYDYYSTAGVLPVVSLQSNIQTSGKDKSGAWNLVVE